MTTITLSSQQKFTANITAYDPVTKIAELDNPVNISMGSNSQLYGDNQAYDITSQYSINGTLTNISNAISNGTKPPTLSSDEAGNFVGILNIPSNTFQTGQRVFHVDNRTVITDPTTATTFAEATFTASGLSAQSQQLDFAPSVDSSSQSFTQVSQQSNQLVAQTVNFQNNQDPVAQTFIVSKDNYPNGMFLNSVKLFFQSKPSTNTPITVCILPTLNGYPTGSALAYSTVSLNPNQVNVADNVNTFPHYLDSTTYTEFVFEAPVYIQPGVLYAIMIKSNSPDYNLYYAQQNQIAIPSTAKANPTDNNPTNPTKIGSAPYVGALFESQNSITWTADQTKDLMFVITQCVFATGTQAVVPFVVPQNLPHRKLGTQDIAHKVAANSVNHVNGNYSPNRAMDAFNVSTTDFSPTGTNISYAYTALVSAGGGTFTSTPQQSVTPGAYGSPMADDVYLNDGQGERYLLRGSSNSFQLFATMGTTDPNVSPIISDDGVSLYTTTYIINNMGIGNNVISIANGGSGYNVQTASVTISNADYGTNAVLGFTANSTGAITSVYVVSPGSGYLTTPTITISDPTTRTSGTPNAVVNIIGETSPQGGNSYAKYYTKKVVLAPGNDSGDMRVYYTAYKPLGTNIYVYYKILSSQDASKFETGNWQLMTQVSSLNTYSSNRTDLIEYECAPGVFLSNQANNNISYTNANGQTFSSYIQFAIKVVMATSDNTNVPFLTDIRALALPAGTGI
jgi:hypothetical protein